MFTLYVLSPATPTLLQNIPGYDGSVDVERRIQFDFFIEVLKDCRIPCTKKETCLGKHAIYTKQVIDLGKKVESMERTASLQKHSLLTSLF